MSRWFSVCMKIVLWRRSRLGFVLRVLEWLEGLKLEDFYYFEGALSDRFIPDKWLEPLKGLTILGTP